MMTACLAGRLNACPVLTGFRIRVATIRLAQGRRKPRSRAKLGHQAGASFILAALVLSLFEPRDLVYEVLAGRQALRLRASGEGIVSNSERIPLPFRLLARLA